MSADDGVARVKRLYGLVTETGDVQGFLGGLTAVAAEMLTKDTGTKVACAIMLRPRRRSIMMAGSSEDAVLLNRLEQGFGDNPSATAMRSQDSVLVNDVFSDRRWPQLGGGLVGTGCCSVLAIPLAAAPAALAVLSFYTFTPGVFSVEVLQQAQELAETASHALSLMLRITANELLAHDLKSALETRTVIDLACGMLMAQNRCTQEEAFAILQEASSNRNQKLHVVAQAVVSAVSGAANITTHFDA